MPKIVRDEEIYQAVMQVISQYGYAGATTRQMAEAAGVSEVTLFRKYESKLQLIKQAVNFLVAESNFPAQIEYTGDLSADLLRVARTYQDSAAQHGQFIFMLLAEMPRFPELTTLLDAPLGIFTEMTALIRRYQSEGQLKRGHPMHMLITLLGPLTYINMLGKAMGSDVIPPLDLGSHILHFIEGYRL